MLKYHQVASQSLFYMPIPAQKYIQVQVLEIAPEYSREQILIYKAYKIMFEFGRNTIVDFVMVLFDL